jgi:hypothetical protein
VCHVPCHRRAVSTHPRRPLPPVTAATAIFQRSWPGARTRSWGTRRILRLASLVTRMT